MQTFYFNIDSENLVDFSVMCVGVKQYVKLVLDM